MTNAFLTAVAAIAVLGLASTKNAPPDGKPYEVSIQFYPEGCVIQQADLLFPLKVFQEIAFREFDTARPIVLNHSKDVPPICVTHVVKAMKKAGFDKISLRSASARRAGQGR